MTDHVRCMLLRGGSSKGAYFLAADLPADHDARAALLRRIMGSPDPRQIDGIGGGHPLTSKVAIVSPSSHVGVDVDYLFLQVGVADDVVTDQQNCGNLLAGVGPFAIERGLLDVPSAGEVDVRIRMLNTNSLATAVFEVADGRPVYSGTTEISGVPGTAAAIRLDFEDIAGSSTGSLLPSGHRLDTIEGRPCTLIDNGMPVVVVAAESLGVTGYEPCDVLESNQQLRQGLEDIRLAAGELMGLGDVRATTVPKVTMVSPARHSGTLSTRTFIPHRCHDAIGVLGAISVATAARLDGTPAHQLATQPPPDTIRLEHPSGFFDVVVEIDTTTPVPSVGRAGIVRTARKIMDGVVFAGPDRGS